MISQKIGHALDSPILSVYRFIFRGKVVPPNAITVAGTFFGLLSAFLISMGRLAPAAVALLISGVLDVLDGAVARSTGRVTRFGGFLDSVLDRYTDLAVMGGIFFFYISRYDVEYAVVAFIAAAGTALIPYARARAEAASLTCKAGLLERPERLVLLIIGLFVPFLLGYIISALAILTHVTVMQRILHVWKQTRGE